MFDYVVFPAQSNLIVFGNDALFPVRRVYFIGRNSTEHAIEMKHSSNKKPPLFFRNMVTILIALLNFPIYHKAIIFILKVKLH